MVLRGYLLDTNIVSYWFTGGSLQHELINTRIQSLPEDSLLAVSAITLGEIEYGHRVVSSHETPVQAHFLEFIEERLPAVFPVEATTLLWQAAGSSLRAARSIREEENGASAGATRRPCDVLGAGDSGK